MNHTFFNTVKSNASGNKRQSRYLENILNSQKEEETVTSNLNTKHAFRGNLAKDLKKQKLELNFSIFEHILE